MQIGKPVITYWGQKLETYLNETLVTAQNLHPDLSNNYSIVPHLHAVSDSKQPAHLLMDTGMTGMKGSFELLLLPIEWSASNDNIKPFVIVVIDEIQLDQAD